MSKSIQIYTLSKTTKTNFVCNRDDSEEEEFDIEPPKKKKKLSPTMDEEINFDSDCKLLKHAIVAMNKATNHNYILMIIRPGAEQMEIFYTHALSKLLSFFVDNKEAIKNMNRTTDENRVTNGLGTITIATSNYIGQMEERHIFYEKSMTNIEYILENSNHIKSYFLIVVNDKNTFVSMSEFIKNFYVINKKKIQEYLKLCFK